MKILTAAEMRDIDRRTTEECGVPSLTLMENAGARVVEALLERFPDAGRRRIVVLCGKGNNGGDGLVAARLLKERGASPEVFLFAPAEKVRGDAAVNLGRWRKAGGEVTEVTSVDAWPDVLPRLAAAEIVIDALLGTGLTGPADGWLREVIDRVNATCANAFVLAVDIPSGLPSDSGAVAGPYVRADATVTFTAPKRSHVLPPACHLMGVWRVVDIGTPKELMERDSNLKTHLLTPADFRSLPLVRQPGAHKGEFGHALIVAGSRGKTGAAVLAAMGALRAGVGLATVATPIGVQPVVAAGLPEVMTEPLEGTEVDTISLGSLEYGRFREIAAGKSVMAIGPGLSTHAATQQFVRTVVSEVELPIILDADGLNAYVGRADELKNRRAKLLALTPHPGEMARLLGLTTQDVQSRRLETALEAAARWSAIVILKGEKTVVATPDGRAWVNPTGNPGMASGGTGDVLTGILAGLTGALGTTAWEVVLGMGVYLHGLAGDLAAAHVGQAPLIASDLVGHIPAAYRQILVGAGLQAAPE